MSLVEQKREEEKEGEKDGENVYVRMREKEGGRVLKREGGRDETRNRWGRIKKGRRGWDRAACVVCGVGGVVWCGVVSGSESESKNGK